MIEYVQHASGRPIFKLPALACDAHCHVFGPFDRYPMYGGRKYTPKEVPIEALRERHDSLGISRAVIVHPSIHGTDNRVTLDAIATDPARYRGVVNIDDAISDRELERMNEGGIRGIRFNFNKNLGGFPDLELVRRSVARVHALDLGWHMVMQIDGENVPELTDLVRALPIPFVVDHMGRVNAKAGTGQPDFLGLLEWMKLEGAWVKLTCPERMSAWPYTEALPYARALLEARPDRVLWGTDFPHPNLDPPPDNVHLVNMVPKFTESDAERQALLVDNPARLYGFA